MTSMQLMELSGWGRYPRRSANVWRPENMREVVKEVPPVGKQVIARGQGRSYGDAAISGHGVVMLTDRLERILMFDESSGFLTAEAGTTLAEVIRQFLPRGWFPAVVPGTKFVSLGGCVAADIHGKNHHRDGGFGSHVNKLKLVLAEGSEIICTPKIESDLFRATVGGMGLTGIITEVACRLIPVESAYVVVRHHQAKDLESSLELLAGDIWDDHYTVAWVDCLSRGRNLGRSVLMRGHHAKIGELKQTLRGRPFVCSVRQHNLNFEFPSWVLNSFTGRMFNDLYYRLQSNRKEPFIADYNSFFFPLDRIGNWNRLYGKRGFIQYQCVLPLETSLEGLRQLLSVLAASPHSSYLAVLKRFGSAGTGLLSFPIDGYTLTFDIPVGNPDLFSFLDCLDEMVIEFGGRVYLAKDARLRAATFRKMYPQLRQWQSVKGIVDPDNRFASDLSRRLELAPVGN